MKIGTYYYPEQWPRPQWERDFDNISKLGLQIVHMAEFAWFELEPNPGKFKFEWLDHCLELARQRKLDVILCTPTASPPIWLSQGWPQTLPVYEAGHAFRFGGRRHYNPLSPDFQAATKRIVTAMAEHFGDHASVIGWQIDNEYSGFFDQSEMTHAAFRSWLKQKYRDIDALNRAWGNQFWNMYYTDFDQILMPPSREHQYANPHQRLDASRFWSWAFAAFNRVQTEILKPKIGSRFVTTNFMHMHPDADPTDMARDLTLTAWDSYPVTGWEKHGDDEAYRMGDPNSIGFGHDQMASYQKRWALMELQPGTINWSGVPVRVHPGSMRLWIWTAFAHGAEFVTTYRFRQPRFGIELFHHGLISTDGVTPSTGGKEFAQVIEEMRRLDLKRVPVFAREPVQAEQTVGLIFDFEQMWYYATMPQARRWNYSNWLLTWYGALNRLGVRVMILRPGMAWPENLPLIVAPAVQMVDERFIEQLSAYSRGGGHLVLTCRTGLMDRTGQLWEGPTASPILPLINASIDGYDTLRDERFGQIEFEGKTYPWGMWGEQLTPHEGTEVLATYADQFYARAAAITRRKAGAGSVSYFGVASEAGLVDAFVQSLAKGTRLRPETLPARVQLLQRGPYKIALNYLDETIDTPAPAGAKMLIGTYRLAPADVAVWE